MASQSTNKGTPLNIIAWLLSLVVLVLAFIAWGQGQKWNFSELSTYQLFPIFGLTAFSLMWAHYIVSASRQYLNVDKAATKQYFEITSFVVLAAIALHPGLLWWQLWRDGFGFPPGSYLNHYVDPGLKWVAVLGTVSLLVFLAYELRRWFGQKPWWRYSQYASDIAMLAIFYHGLRLGGQLQSGWFHTVWLVYGVTLVGALFYQYASKLQNTKIQKP